MGNEYCSCHQARACTLVVIAVVEEPGAAASCACVTGYATQARVTYMYVLRPSTMGLEKGGKIEVLNVHKEGFRSLSESARVGRCSDGCHHFQLFMAWKRFVISTQRSKREELRHQTRNKVGG